MTHKTLQERLISEAREKYYEKKSPNCGNLDQIILHTIEQTIKEGCGVVEGMKLEYPVDAQPTTKEFEMRINWANPVVHQALTDTQQALRGIMK